MQPPGRGAQSVLQVWDVRLGREFYWGVCAVCLAYDSAADREFDWGGRYFLGAFAVYFSNDSLPSVRPLAIEHLSNEFPPTGLLFKYFYVFCFIKFKKQIKAATPILFFYILCFISIQFYVLTGLLSAFLGRS